MILLLLLEYSQIGELAENHHYLAVILHISPAY
jgi:hypothetical protein